MYKILWYIKFIPSILGGFNVRGGYEKSCDAPFVKVFRLYGEADRK
jgi:hypothetical protein